MASRGKLTGKTFVRRAVGSDSLPTTGLTDPFFQDMNPMAKSYVLYFGSHVCKELVLYDIPKHNQFRDLIPMAQQHEVLLHTIIAVSALHLSHSARSRRLAAEGKPMSASLQAVHDVAFEAMRSDSDAILAKQRALGLLRSILDHVNSANVDVILATILLFIQYELLYSGRDGWICHLQGAKAIIEEYCTPQLLWGTQMSPFRSFLVSNCIVLDILGSAFVSSDGSPAVTSFPVNSLSLLHDAEGNLCSSFPSALLLLLRAGASILDLFQQKDVEVLQVSSKQAMSLLREGQSFNPDKWTATVQRHLPVEDKTARNLVARAHRTAICIYLSYVAESTCPGITTSDYRQFLANETLMHVSAIRKDNILFPATAWPTFVAGAEIDNIEWQNWVVERFQELWKVEPWGLIRGASEVLRGIWAEKKAARFEDKVGGTPFQAISINNWVLHIRSKGVHWLIT